MVSSLPLVEYLSKRQIWCCGTVRPNRLQNLKMLSDDELKKQGRGSIDAWHTSDAGTELVCVKWFDNKSVHLLSSFLQAHPVDLVERFDKKQNKTVEVPRPNIVKQYNKCMGGVDLADMLLALYRIEVKSKKFYHRFIFHLLDICVVNSWILYRRNINAEAGKQTKYMPLIYFKMLIVEGLISTGKPRSCTPKRGRPSSQMNSEEDTPPPRRTKNQRTPSSQIIHDHTDHMPIITPTRLRCKMKNCSSKTNVSCEKCKVNLCLNKTNNHFKDFHL